MQYVYDDFMEPGSSSWLGSSDGMLDDLTLFIDIGEVDELSGKWVLLSSSTKMQAFECDFLHARVFWDVPQFVFTESGPVFFVAIDGLSHIVLLNRPEAESLGEVIGLPWH